MRHLRGAHGRARLRPGPRIGVRAGGRNPASTTARNLSSVPPPPPPPRLDRLVARLPRRLQPYTRRLRDAPVSHVTAFVLLHELTAIVPLVGLFGLFHWGYLAAPFDWAMARYGDSVAEGGARLERYFRRRGWFGFGFGGEAEGKDATATATATAGAGGEAGGTGGRVASEAGGTRGRGSSGETANGAGKEELTKKWQSADPRYRAVVEGALAYAITKALLPARIAVSLWATPWLARGLVRLRGFVGRKW